MEKPNKQLQNSRRFLFSLPKALKNGRLGKSAFFLSPPLTLCKRVSGLLLCLSAVVVVRTLK